MIVNPTIFKKSGGVKVYSRTGDGNIEDISLEFDEPVRGFVYWGNGRFGSTEELVVCGVDFTVDDSKTHAIGGYSIIPASSSSSPNGFRIPIEQVSQNKILLKVERSTLVGFVNWSGKEYFYVGIPEDA